MPFGRAMLEEVLLLHQFAKGSLGKGQRRQTAGLRPDRCHKRILDSQEQEAMCSLFNEQGSQSKGRVQRVKEFRKSQKPGLHG